MFHTACLKNWVSKHDKDTCPMCRSNIGDDILSKFRPNDDHLTIMLELVQNTTHEGPQAPESPTAFSNMLNSLLNPQVLGHILYQTIFQTFVNNDP